MSYDHLLRAFALATIAGLVVLVGATFSTRGRAEALPHAVAPDQPKWLEVSQKAIGNLVGDYRFVTAKGTSVTIGDQRGKPLVVSLIYTSCSHVCPLTTQRLRRAVEEARRVIGADRFTVITVGFDVRNDTPMRMAAFARAQGVDAANWHLLSGDAASVSALASDLGFSYAARAGGFVHAAQTTIVDREGRVYRQVYGDDFPIQVFMEPLKEAVYGTVGTFLSVEGLLDRVRFLCTVYDPNQGRYRISYAIAMTLLTGVISLGVTAMVISRAWLNSRRA
jgi:protein SCO1/2